MPPHLRPQRVIDLVVIDSERLREPHAAAVQRGRDKEKAAWGEILAEMKSLGIEYHPDWAQKAK
jgi:hypothetical protein